MCSLTFSSRKYTEWRKKEAGRIERVGDVSLPTQFEWTTKEQMPTASKCVFVWEYLTALRRCHQRRWINLVSLLPNANVISCWRFLRFIFFGCSCHPFRLTFRANVVLAQILFFAMSMQNELTPVFLHFTPKHSHRTFHHNYMHIYFQTHSDASTVHPNTFHKYTECFSKFKSIQLTQQYRITQMSDLLFYEI